MLAALGMAGGEAGAALGKRAERTGIAKNITAAIGSESAFS
jgi:hypothetical protein